MLIIDFWSIDFFPAFPEAMMRSFPGLRMLGQERKSSHTGTHALSKHTRTVARGPITVPWCLLILVGNEPTGSNRLERGLGDCRRAGKHCFSPARYITHTQRPVYIHAVAGGGARSQPNERVTIMRGPRDDRRASTSGVRSALRSGQPFADWQRLAVSPPAPTRGLDANDA